MSKPLSRAERYKRNYRLIVNTYQDSKLAKKYQSASDTTLYNDLGIKIPKKYDTKIPELKKIKQPTVKQRSYYKRKLEKFQESRQNGINVEASILLRKKTFIKKKIKSNNIFQDDPIGKSNFSLEDRERRKEIWKEWSSNNNKNFPPEIELQAIDLNRSQGFDDYDRFGFAYMYYAYLENSYSVASSIVKPQKYGIETYSNARRRITVTA